MQIDERALETHARTPLPFAFRDCKIFTKVLAFDSNGHVYSE